MNFLEFILDRFSLSDIGFCVSEKTNPRCIVTHLCSCVIINLLLSLILFAALPSTMSDVKSGKIQLLVPSSGLDQFQRSRDIGKYQSQDRGIVRNIDVVTRDDMSHVIER
jgi:hypothetical protein